MFERKNSDATQHTVNSLYGVYDYLYGAIEEGQARGYDTQRLEIIVMNVYTALIQTKRTLTCRSMPVNDRRFLSKIISKTMAVHRSEF
jgi:hypothetical protein